MPALPQLPDFQLLTVAGLLFAAGMIALLMFVVLRARRRMTALNEERESLRNELDALRREARGAVELAVRAGRQLRVAEQDIKQIQEQMRLLELRGEDRSYDQAIRLARKGADAGELIENLGLSRGEAELMERLHTPRRAG